MINIKSNNNLYFFSFITTLLLSLESIKVDLYGNSVKPLVLVSLIFGLFIITNKLYIPKYFRYLFIWWLSTLLAFINGSIISLNDTLTVFSGQFLLLLITLSVYNIFRSSKRYATIFYIGFFDAIVFLGVISSIVGIIEILAFYLVGNTFGIFHPESMGFARAESFFSEPDWFGYFISVSIILIFSKKNKSFYGNILKGILFLGLFASGTRAALFGLLIVIILHHLIYKFSIVKIAKFTFTILSVLLMLSLIVPEKMVQRYNPSTMTTNDGGAFDSRLYTMILTIDYILKNPWFGNGAGGLGTLTTDIDNMKEYASGGELNAGRGGSNLVLTSLFDVGIIGTIPLIIFLFLMLKKIFINLIWLTPENETDRTLIAFSLIFLFTIIETMINNMIRYGLFWMILGIFFYFIFLKDRINE